MVNKLPIRSIINFLNMIFLAINCYLVKKYTNILALNFECFPISL